MRRLDPLKRAIEALDDEGLLDEPARERILVATLGTLNRERSAATAARERDARQLQLDGTGRAA